VNAIEMKTLTVGEGPGAREIAIEQRPGTTPGIFWLGGFKSDMIGSKAMALDAFGAAGGQAVTRLDYSGHGRSGGAFTDGTISRWLEEALAVFALTTGPQIVVGSSMGGWLTLLLNKALRESGKSRVKAMVLIAPAVDMTEDLMKPDFTPQELIDLRDNGFAAQPSQYSDQPYIITRALIEDGDKHLLFTGPIETGCPVTILQGGLDPDVPLAHAQKLLTHLVLDPAVLTLIPDGDHRLSRPQDLEVLVSAVRRAGEE
jgi:pimeloyl-ACP methyl ester carboxylesterase